MDSIQAIQAEKKKVAIIMGSSRSNRLCVSITKWFVEASKLKDHYADLEIIDLVEWSLPLYDEAVSPMALNGNYTTEIGRKWQAKIGSIDAFVMISPEYNQGYTSIFKNAIDYLIHEWQGKPLIVVSYGYGGGLGVNKQISDILSGVSPIQMRLTETRPKLHISRPMFDESGQIKDFSPFDKHLEDIRASVTEFIILNNTPFKFVPKWY
ncbi:hypothetical protein SAMD00019534_054190 [Acytostelium subglobosum LB1]|uniref:hypothetical protein n=1 Tax=Acytostelium subglobosum LB1 TaxID=1410327 RepID=UPI0006451742|nr:hypothetical protein SAMD00019534_054190 [Acytostelium subglobosum LB1]GAM22244.1 hypothetical protein SAMD00019534_054190 [Acytostelium subglobosum LB1]|eukprot:XP_012754364.1 hypothetical protein SAMD00019534_054190 [Acytostelium subglobosum LB1]